MEQEKPLNSWTMCSTEICLFSSSFSFSSNNTNNNTSSNNTFNNREEASEEEKEIKELQKSVISHLEEAEMVIHQAEKSSWFWVETKLDF